MTTGATSDGWSAYDEAVPHVSGLPAVVAHTTRLRAERMAARPDPATLDAVRQVVVVVASSRGGSSLFGEVLRRIPGLVHLRAEVNPLFALAGLHDGAERRRALEDEIALDAGCPAGPEPAALGPDEQHRLALDLAWRLVVQWPEVADRLAVDALVDRLHGHVRRHADPFDRDRLHLSTLAGLHELGIGVDGRYYDLPAAAADPRYGSDPPTGPPSDAFVEMPPFVAVDRWRPATIEDLGRMPLVVSTPRCSFRLEFLRDLFPTAAVRVVHLTRNPAASVNGLIDGWLHHGFFNCRVPGGLRIEGYSERVRGGREWWCYDLPPGWERWVEAPLPEVCAFQWRETHRAALGAVERLGADCIRIRFEDVVGPLEARADVLRRLAAWLDLEPGAALAAAAAELPVVMATEAPAPARWRARQGVLLPVLRHGETAALAEELGYGRDLTAWA